MWSEPVTFGGGMTIEYAAFFPPDAARPALKALAFSHSELIRGSMSAGRNVFSSIGGSVAFQLSGRDFRTTVVRPTFGSCQPSLPSTLSSRVCDMLSGARGRRGSAGRFPS